MLQLISEVKIQPHAHYNYIVNLCYRSHPVYIEFVYYTSQVAQQD